MYSKACDYMHAYSQAIATKKLFEYYSSENTKCSVSVHASMSLRFVFEFWIQTIYTHISGWHTSRLHVCVYHICIKWPPRKTASYTYMYKHNSCVIEYAHTHICTRHIQRRNTVLLYLTCSNVIDIIIYTHRILTGGRSEPLNSYSKQRDTFLCV